MRNPFIAGNWVRGEHFFGRQNLIDEILNGERHYLWVAATRRFGKTSLLKQIEFLTNDGPFASKYVSLFWDMQGSKNVEGLKESLLESVEDAELRFSAISVEIDELEKLDLFGILRTLKRKAKERQLRLLLLCDEVEELINVQQDSPDALPKLRRFFQRGENVYTVLVATKRLVTLAETSMPNTSPFLNGFLPPTYLPRLEDEEARGLICQWAFEPAETTEILQKTDNHPYLIQVICSRLVESGNLARVVDEISHDEMISHFFSVDFQALHEEEKRLLLHLLHNEELSMDEAVRVASFPRETVAKRLYELVQSGIVSEHENLYHVANFFFRKWLAREKESLYSESDLKRAQPEGSHPTATQQVYRLPSVGERLGQHEILDKIASGGMGVIFRGLDLDLDRKVALKVLAPQLMADDEFKARFLLEARAASALNHPNICTIFQVGEERGLLYISLELVDGQTLRDWATASVRTLAQKLRVAIEAGTGLAHAHDKGVIHRDIKTDNIMVAHDGSVKVMDFGLAKISVTEDDARLTKTGTTMGTPAYMSPEQISGLDIDARSDIYSFGVVMYELLGGKLPFTGEQIFYEIVNEEPEPLGKVDPSLPATLQQLVHRALEKDRKSRYQSMEQLLEDLTAVYSVL